MAYRTLSVLGRLGLLGGLLMVLGGAGGVGAAHAQQPAPDSVQAEPLERAPLAPLDSNQAGSSSSEEGRAFVNADSLSTLSENGERIQRLFGNVFVRQDTTRLRSEFGLRYLERDRFLFTDDVVIYQRGDTLTADTVRYNKETKVGHAYGNVRLTDGEVVVRAPEATYFVEEKRSVFPDSVTLVDSTRVLRARRGTYWSNEQRAEFGGRVELTDPETVLESDSLTYLRDTKRSIARGNVFVERQREGAAASADTTARTYLFGDRVDNQNQRRYSRVDGRALLVRVRTDSSGAPTDTLVVQARHLEAQRTDTYRRLVAIDSVRIWQPDLAAVADSAVYHRVLATGPTEPPAEPASAPGPPDPTETPAASDPRPELVPDSIQVAPDTTAPPDTTARPDTTAARPSIANAPPDSLRTGPTRADSTRLDSTATTAQNTTTTDSARTARWTVPSTDDDARLPLEETRLFRSPITWFEQSQVWGDSIRVRARQRSLDTMFVRGAAFAAQGDSALKRVHQLKARDITAFFRADSLRRIRARPNAQAIRFLAERDTVLRGAAQVSGDRIVFRLRNGRVRKISTIGGVESTYYRLPETIPDPFELSGFMWVPERQPTQRGLLDEPRVRRGLDRQFRSRPPLAQQETSPPDSGRSAPSSPRVPPDTTSPVPDSLGPPPESRRPPPPDRNAESPASPRPPFQSRSHP